MGETKPRVIELENPERYHAYDHFGMEVVGISEDGIAEAEQIDPEQIDPEKGYTLWPGNCSVLRFRCKKCGAEFDVEPNTEAPNVQNIPLCPKGCNIDLLEKWVDEQERKKRGS